MTKTTPTARSKFSAQIRSFLEENKHFDECLAVRLAAETREWGCLAHLTEIRGLACEMAEAVVAVAVGESRDDKEEGEAGGAGEDVAAEVGRCLRDMSTTEREGLLGCLLHEGTVEAIVTASFSSPLARKAAMKHLKVLLATLPLLEEAGLASVLRQCGPTNSGLWSSYLQVLRGESQSVKQNSRQARRGRERHEAGDDTNTAVKEEEEEATSDLEVARSLVNLTVSTALLLLKKRKTKVNTNTTSTSECKPVCDIIPRRFVVMPAQKSDEDDAAAPKVRRRLASAGAGHVLVVAKGGERLWAWGAAANGVLGRGATAARFCTPRKIDLFPQGCGVRVRAVACGKAHSLALTDAGLFAWGSSNFGQLGIGRLRRSEQRPAAVRALMGEPIVSIAAGQYHSAAVDATGGLWTWGWGVHGQLGNGDIEDAFEPVRIFRKRKVTQVSAGYAHTLALAEDGSLWSFGCGLWGQLGVGVTKKATRPKRVIFPEGEDDKVKFVECGYFHNLAVKESGKMFTWGCNPQVLI